MKILRVIPFIFLFLTACRKEDDGNAMDFKITGVHDIEIEKGQRVSRIIRVFYLGGRRERVTVSSVSLPHNVSITYDHNNQVPDFEITQAITVSMLADTGLFMITVQGKSESGKIFNKTFQLIIHEVRDDPPVIIPNGNLSQQLRLNDQWFDPGVIATDAEDGDLTSQVIVSGNVNSNLTGLYPIAYRVTDSGGNTTTLTRTVQVYNDVNFITGNYSCVTNTPDSTFGWITSIDASATQNNRFIIYKIGDLFMANPQLNWNPLTDSIYLATQSMIGISPSDTFLHTFNGRGKVIHTPAHVSIQLFYSDSYTDANGSVVTKNKTDTYNN